MNNNIVLDTDSYKASHWLQYPPNTIGMFSYLESRGGVYPKTVFFGLQYLLKEYLSKPVTKADVDEGEEFFKAHGLPFNRAGWDAIVEKHRGKLPVRIRAVPEGSVIPTKNILMSVESTGNKDTFWVVSWLETMLMRLWYPITVSTQSYTIKQTIKKFLDETSDNPEAELPFKLHDFGSRGVSSAESAAIGGAAHLVNFQGSDTVNGILLANRYYGSKMAGFSIPAAEHSSITSWGRDHEADAYRNMLKQFGKPGALLAVVSDSYDIFNAASNIWGEELKQEVIDSVATVVIRPDSGEPVTVVNRLLHILDARFGSVKNSKGYRVLNNVRIIQGDGINGVVIEAILKSAKLAGYSATNIAFGMGGALLQQVNRDTQRFAFKCSSIEVFHPLGDASYVERRDVFKDPATDPGKASKKGRLDLICTNGVYETTSGSVYAHGRGLVPSAMQTVFENGEILVETTLDEVRARANRP